ncbi:hypothetical protein [uncultured Sphingomonas sp.]|uniref:hypothetical protein n=1 Tax=uncultured Sphingomonas sp. TaxID=158754 RepID=UPI0035CB36D4
MIKTSHLLAASTLALATAAPAFGQNVDPAVQAPTAADETTQVPAGPSAGTTVDIIGPYFKEDDRRLRS